MLKWFYGYNRWAQRVAIASDFDIFDSDWIVYVKIGFYYFFIEQVFMKTIVFVSKYNIDGTKENEKEVEAKINIDLRVRTMEMT